ncbi:MAG: hypothetical protein AAF546_00185 [Verrucomicrobiota bacterium]
MALSPLQTAELSELNAEIARCELVLGVTDGLGASHSDLGQTATYTTQQIERAEKRLPLLRARKRQLDAIAADEPTNNPYVAIARVRKI